MSKILIPGATGLLGKAVVNQLLQKMNPNDINVHVRDISKAEDVKEKGVNIIKGDYSEYASPVNGFMGMNNLYFISSSELNGRIYQHENVVNAAREAKAPGVRMS